MRFRYGWFVLFGLAEFCIVNVQSAEVKPAPLAEKKPVFNEYHGTKVEDDYQWLENDDDPAVKTWSDTENKRTRAYLDSLRPGAEPAPAGGEDDEPPPALRNAPPEQLGPPIEVKPE